MDWKSDTDYQERDRSLSYLKQWDKLAFFADILVRPPVFIFLSFICLLISGLLLFIR
jgi:hypothetical protein